MTVAAAGLLNWLLWDLIRPQGGPLFMLAVVVSAWYGGRGPGVAAAVLATLARATFYQEPVLSPLIEAQDLVLAPIFLLTAVVISYLTGDRVRGARQVSRAVQPTGAATSEPVPAPATEDPAPALTSPEAAPRAARATVSRVRAGRWGVVPPLVLAFFIADVLLGALYVMSRVGSRLQLLSEPVISYVDLDRELNLPSWYAAAQLFLIGLLLAVFAGAQFVRRQRDAWAVALAGLAFLFLSIDEATLLHENFSKWLDARFGARRSGPFHLTGYWMLICAPLFLGIIALLGFAARRLFAGRWKILRLYVAAVAVFVFAAAGIESVSNFIPPYTHLSRLAVMLEEVGEMIGGTMILWATLELLRSHGVRLVYAPAQTEAGSGASGS
jgi:hypothetical protein